VKPAVLLLPLFFVLSLISRPSFCREADFPGVDQPQKKLFIGEKIVYTIHYLGLPVGKSQAEVKEVVEMGGRKAYHVVVFVRSYPWMDLLYKVRDEHHSFIDVEKLHSLRYEKDLREGFSRAQEEMNYDQENHVARYFYPKKKSEKEMAVPPDVQDQLSCGYYFRTLAVQPNTSVFIPVNADQKNWNLEVKLHGVVSMEIKGIGRFQALETEPLMEFQGIFVKRGKIRGWISLDERRIPLKMKVKIPVIGNVVAVLSDYQPGNRGTQNPPPLI
jgi:hypothetical protein